MIEPFDHEIGTGKINVPQRSSQERGESNTEDRREVRISSAFHNVLVQAASGLVDENETQPLLDGSRGWLFPAAGHERIDLCINLLLLPVVPVESSTGRLALSIGVGDGLE